MTLDAATSLLDDFRKLPGRVERPRTFMEIAGYPHYENVCSNILAFFMDPEESHGLKILVLDALLSSIEDDSETGRGVGGNVSVEREVTTEKGRIDILITSDDCAVIIENKIRARVDNPFDDYALYLDRIAGTREKHKFLLTIDPTDAGSEWCFINLTHEQFVEQIRSLLGHHISNADTRYLMMFLDFLNTLENLRKETHMDAAFIELLAERGDDAENLFAELLAFRNELRKKVRDLGILIDVEKYQHVKQFHWRETTGLYDDLVHNIRVTEDLLVSIDTSVGPQGWDIYIWPRHGDHSELRVLLQNLEIPFEEDVGFVHPARFAYDEALEQISPVLQDLIVKIATYQEARWTP